MVRDPTYGLSAEALKYARQRYEETNDSQGSISADLGNIAGDAEQDRQGTGLAIAQGPAAARSAAGC